MGPIPGDVDAERGPPMAVPLAHFAVGLAFLVGGSLVGLAAALGVAGAALAHVHLLLVGWVCLTIAGAMTQFVPVWAGVELHSRRLAVAQLWLLAAGTAGFGATVLAGALPWLAVPGALMVAGLAVLVYNVGRTLARARPLDVTTGHFAVALGCFALAAPLGLALASGYAVDLGLSVPRHRLKGAHVTLAVFGAVLTTVVGALYQLATMFTNTELDGLDRRLVRFESVGYPVGVLALAAGRLLGVAALARGGGLLVAAGLAAVAVVLARRLRAARVERTPMLTRYAAVAVALGLWAPIAAVRWTTDPLAPGATFGGPAATHLLLVGVVAVVVAGTLYHVVPFIVWVDRYADRLGLEPVPMIDDLYDDRLAAVDLVGFLGGTAALALGDAGVAPALSQPAGGVLLTLGGAVFAANLLGVVREHGPGAVAVLAAGRENA